MNTNKNIFYMLVTMVIGLFVPVFLHAQAPYASVSLGANISSAPAIETIAAAAVQDGTENYFKIEAEHLPATVYYLPDTAFGPIPMLICVGAKDDTLTSTMGVEQCIMGWKWELDAAGEEETVRYLYFSSHENAKALIMPFVCQTITTTLSDTAACDECIWGDTAIYDSGIYTRRYTAVNGCDSLVSRKVTILTSSNPTLVKVSAYDSYTWLDGKTYTQSIIGPSWELKNIAGCDSTLTLDLTIRHIYKDTVHQSVCESQLPYRWQGRSFSEGGTFTTDTIVSKTVTTDTLHTLVLTVGQPTKGEVSYSTYASNYTWHGTIYTKSGDYPFLTTNVAGCDSLVTLHLTLRSVHKDTVRDAVCEAQLPYQWQGRSIAAAGMFTTDTILSTTSTTDSLHTLVLKVNQPTSGEETRSAYDSYTWNGNTYTESGEYTYHTTNAAGCDSTATLHLTILPSAVTYDTVYFCTGMNTEHEEQLDPRHIRRYIAYTYESPANWDYMDGVILVREQNRMQVDLHHAEQNLYNYYTDNLVPIRSIAWSYRPDGSAAYQALEVSNAPQWIASGTVAVSIRFVCGQTFTSDFATDITEVTDEQTNGRKMLIDGQIIIIRNGHKYNMLGTKIE